MTTDLERAVFPLYGGVVAKAQKRVVEARPLGLDQVLVATILETLCEINFDSKKLTSHTRADVSPCAIDDRPSNGQNVVH